MGRGVRENNTNTIQVIMTPNEAIVELEAMGFIKIPSSVDYEILYRKNSSPVDFCCSIINDTYPKKYNSLSLHICRKDIVSMITLLYLIDLIKVKSLFDLFGQHVHAVEITTPNEVYQDF